MNTFNYPKIGFTNDKKVFVYFYINKKRYRLYNGERIKSNLKPNTYPIIQRKHMAKLLAAEIYSYINKGGVVTEYRTNKIVIGKQSDLELLNQALNVKLDDNFSKSYKKELKYAHKKLLNNMISSSVSKHDIIKTLSFYKNSSSYNSVLYISSITIGSVKSPILLLINNCLDLSKKIL